MEFAAGGQLLIWDYESKVFIPNSKKFAVPFNEENLRNQVR